VTDRTFDRGRQPERTDLAWQRTVLAVAIGSLISLRLLPPVLGTWGFLIGATGLLAAAFSGYLARRRAQHVAATLSSTALPPGAGLLLLIAVTTAAGAGVGLLYTLLLAFDHGRD
jgi:uncharacterized membrane protein YidH (DUF202 family)